ncbi:hypothetical protein PROFUN_07602 [Planoprotostelium fungivorum]|uniref:Uncharacterized protein n=1 Tax=Planoprotostelium fungivorum TaxID=1890364 RepID=A0A2P6NK21_9EUKA|nr:hypothetical protein PROFUN_07602 [Planoprotostelium fungivorum]
MHTREEGTPMLYLGWVRPYSVHHSLVRHSPAFIVEALERVSPLRPESNTFVYRLCGRAEDIQFSARRQYWPYISRSVVGLTPDSSLVTSHRQLRDNNSVEDLVSGWGQIRELALDGKMLRVLDFFVLCCEEICISSGWMESDF